MTPKDPVMLLSYVNTKLRDNFSNLEDFCLAENSNMESIKNALSLIGYEYDPELNRFV